MPSKLKATQAAYFSHPCYFSISFKYLLIQCIKILDTPKQAVQLAR